MSADENEGEESGKVPCLPITFDEPPVETDPEFLFVLGGRCRTNMT